MKNATSIGMLAAVAFAVGMTGINLSDGTFVLQGNTPSATQEGASILGHIEVIHADSEGNILSYQQTDNAIVNDGRNCTAMLLFGANSDCTAATAAALGKYTVIGVGNGTALTATTDTTVLTSELNGTNFGDGMARTLGTLGTYTSSTGASGPGNEATQRISNAFTYNGTLANTINQAGLFNQTTISGTGTFALKNFPSSVTMNTNDQLTVNWDITIDGSDSVGP